MGMGIAVHYLLNTDSMLSPPEALRPVRQHGKNGVRICQKVE